MKCFANCVHKKKFIIMAATYMVLFNFSMLALGADPTDLSRLRQDILTGYDPNVRPILNHKNTTYIQLNPYLRGFEFDENRGVFTLYCWTVMSWNDEHLRWDPKNYNNLSFIHYGSKEIWKPDISVYNNLDQSEIDHFGNTRIVGYSSGNVVWVPPTKFQVGCNEDLRNWPYDTQKCDIILGSWSHDGLSLALVLPVNKTKIDGVEVVENREWTLVETELKERRIYFNGIPYPDLVISVTIRRRSGTHSAAVVLPAIAISIAILLSFWLRPAAFERLSLILLVILINSIYLNKVYVQILTHGDRVPLVLLFYRDSLLMVSLALFWTICLRLLASSKRTSPVPLPGFIQTAISSIPGKILCLDARPSDGPSGPNADMTDDEGKLVSNSNPYQADWAWLAHLLDRIAFLIYLIVYICFYLALL